MFDENLIATLEQSLRQTRNAQSRLMGRLREVEVESEKLREEIQALENSAAQTESAIDSLLVTMRSGNRSLNLGKTLRIEDDYDRRPAPRKRRDDTKSQPVSSYRPANSVAYINQNRGGVPSRTNNIEPISHRFADRTITQACTLLLREAGKPLHVNELIICSSPAEWSSKEITRRYPLPSRSIATGGSARLIRARSTL